MDAHEKQTMVRSRVAGRVSLSALAVVVLVLSLALVSRPTGAVLAASPSGTNAVAPAYGGLPECGYIQAQLAAYGAVSRTVGLAYCSYLQAHNLSGSSFPAGSQVVPVAGSALGCGGLAECGYLAAHSGGFAAVGGNVLGLQSAQPVVLGCAGQPICGNIQAHMPEGGQVNMVMLWPLPTRPS